MSEQHSNHFKAWELALLCALCLTLCAALWAQRQSDRISESLIRLHVLAVDDSAEEQALKLRVRDAVLDFLSPRLEGIESKTEAAELLSRSLPELQSAAAAAAGAGRSRLRSRASIIRRGPTGAFLCPREATTRCASSSAKGRAATGGASSSRRSA